MSNANDSLAFLPLRILEFICKSVTNVINSVLRKDKEHLMNEIGRAGLRMSRCIEMLGDAVQDPDLSQADTFRLNQLISGGAEQNEKLTLIFNRLSDDKLDPDEFIDGFNLVSKINQWCELVEDLF